MAIGAATKIESYLPQVRAALRGLPEREIEHILRELRSHALDLGGEDERQVDKALSNLAG